MDENELKKRLTQEQYAVLRQKATEAPFSGDLLYNREKGTYNCAACGQELFSSKTKYESGSGWPSFYDVIIQGNVKLRLDKSIGTERTEVLCASCGSHLGHVFSDGPNPTHSSQSLRARPSESKTGKRYCINSLALDFKKED